MSASISKLCEGKIPFVCHAFGGIYIEASEPIPALTTLALLMALGSHSISTRIIIFPLLSS